MGLVGPQYLQVLVSVAAMAAEQSAELSGMLGICWWRIRLARNTRLTAV